jgi:hypothetical protein
MNPFAARIPMRSLQDDLEQAGQKNGGEGIPLRFQSHHFTDVASILSNSHQYARKERR